MLADAAGEAGDVRGGEGVVIAERHAVDEVPAGRFEIGEEAVRAGDAGHGDDRPIARQAHGAAPRIDGARHRRPRDGGEGVRHAPPRRQRRGAGRRLAGDDQRVGVPDRAERLAQAAAGQRLVAFVGRGHHREIDVAGEGQVLEAVVEQVDGGAEAALGEGAGPEAIRDSTKTPAPGTPRASISGSSPARARSASARTPSLTTVTPSTGSVRR